MSASSTVASENQHSQPVRELGRKIVSQTQDTVKAHPTLAWAADRVVLPASHALQNTRLGQRVVQMADAGLSLVDSRVENYTPTVRAYGEKVAEATEPIRSTCARVVHNAASTSAALARKGANIIKETRKTGEAEQEDYSSSSSAATKTGGGEGGKITKNKKSGHNTTTKKRRRTRPLAIVRAVAANAAATLSPYVSYVSHISASHCPEGCLANTTARVVLGALTQADRLLPLPALPVGESPSSSSSDEADDTLAAGGHHPPLHPQHHHSHHDHDPTIGTLSTRLVRRGALGLARSLRLASSIASTGYHAVDNVPVVAAPRDAIAHAAAPITTPAASWLNYAIHWLEPEGYEEDDEEDVYHTKNKQQHHNNKSGGSGAGRERASSSSPSEEEKVLTSLWTGSRPTSHHQQPHHQQQHREQKPPLSELVDSSPFVPPLSNHMNGAAHVPQHPHQNEEKEAAPQDDDDHAQQHEKQDQQPSSNHAQQQILHHHSQQQHTSPPKGNKKKGSR